MERQSLKDDKSLWLPRQAVGFGPFGLRIIVRQFWAFYEFKTERWDIASAVDFSIQHEHDNPWHEFQAEPDRDEKVRKIVDLWQQFPAGNQCFFKIITVIKYADIIEVDDIGDHLNKVPTIFVSFKNGAPPYSNRTKYFFEMRSCGAEGEFDPAKHALVFPDEMRNIYWEGLFFKDLRIDRATEQYPVTLTEPEWKRKRLDNPD